MKQYFLYIKNDFHKTIYLILFIICSLFSVAPLFPCNVPVFRYALERWTAAPYRLMIFYKGQLSTEHSSLLKGLEHLSFQGDSTLNLVTRYMDLNKSGENPLQGRDENLTYPLMMLFYPEETGIPYPLWLGELTESNIELLKASPARKEIADMLISGETAVFLFLESGNPELDQKYYQILNQELTILSTQLRIPTSAVDINGNALEINDFQQVDLNFPIIKVSRKNPAEQLFISILLGTESDLSDYQVPLVFPVFGQGRSLYALVGSGINKNTIEKACQALVNWCSCEIKALHQGVDLLFLAEWSQGTGESWIKAEELPPLTGLSGFIESSGIMDDITENADENESDTITVRSRENPDGTSDSQSDSTRQIFAEAEIQESFSISTTIGWFLLVLTGLIIFLTILISKRKMRVKR